MKLIPLLKRDGSICGHSKVNDDDYDRTIARGTWRLHSGKYACMMIHTKGEKPRCLLMHRFLLGDTLEPGQQADHENGDKLDNQVGINLRPSTPRQNALNRAKFKGCSSKYRGVSWNKKAKKWRASICLGQPSVVYIGSYDTEIEAHEAYQAYLIELDDPDRNEYGYEDPTQGETG